MTYTQAKSAAYDESVTDPKLLREAAAVLMARLDASDEDMSDASGLITRARRVKSAA